MIGFGLSDKSFLGINRKIKTISNKHSKYYGTLIMLSNHTPFDDLDKYGEFPVDYKINIVNEDGIEEEITRPYMEGTSMGNYLKSVHYADAAIGEFIAGLETEGLLKDTVIVIYGDHDARLPKKDFIRLYNYDPYTDTMKDVNDPTYRSFDYYEYELNRKVPLIIWSKEKMLKTEVSEMMGMYDVLPTLGNMFDFRSEYQLGNDIFSVDNNVVIFPNGNWLTKDIYYNNQKQEFKLLNDSAVVSQEYINKFSKIAYDKINVSNNIILFDYIRKSKETEKLLETYKN